MAETTPEVTTIDVSPGGTRVLLDESPVDGATTATVRAAMPGLSHGRRPRRSPARAPWPQPHVRDALAAASPEREMIGCHDGTVLLVACHGAWAHEIAGPGRKHACATTGYTGFQDAREGAIRHADQSWGGVAWQLRP